MTLKLRRIFPAIRVSSLCAMAFNMMRITCRKSSALRETKLTLRRPKTIFEAKCRRNVYGLLLCIAVASGCVTVPLRDRTLSADRIAQTEGFTKSHVKAGPFILTAYHRFNTPGEPLTVYIEGDGYAWVSRMLLSDDPTPRQPLVLELAGIDPAPNVLYLARPGQYTAGGVAPCNALYWSDERFSAVVVEAMNEEVENFRRLSQAEHIHLIGYSGGAAIAVLIAARRSDIISLRTIAGNLDSDAVSHYHRVSPLKGSLNPIDMAPALSRLPQRHFVGTKDKVVPLFIAQEFIKRERGSSCAKITSVGSATHTSGWRKRWQELLALPVTCAEDVK
jgi:hypothetical protein